MMEKIVKKLEEAIELMGFEKPKITIDEEYRKISVFIDDDIVQSQAEEMLPALDHVCNAMLRKEGIQSYVVDLNYYRKERERLIIELARAAAHKIKITKEEVELPPMNSYERRVVHVELADKPDLKTESLGEGKDRRVVIKLIETA